MKHVFSRTFITGLLLTAVFSGSIAHAKWIDPEAEANKYKKIRAWQGVDFTFTGFSSAGGTNALTYRNTVNDLWEWNAGAGIAPIGMFFTGGGRYFVYNSPNTTCFFMFSCHGQVTTGLNLDYSMGGRKTFGEGAGETRYDVGNGIAAWPTAAFRSIYSDFFSISLAVGYRVMLQKPSINRGFGPGDPSGLSSVEKEVGNGLGASLSLGFVF
jgi:hypothetical protein